VAKEQCWAKTQVAGWSPLLMIRFHCVGVWVWYLLYYIWPHVCPILIGAKFNLCWTFWSIVVALVGECPYCYNVPQN